MNISFLFSMQFFQVLMLMDQEMAVKEKEKGCPYCCGRLDFASYPRKPRGGPKELKGQEVIRYSLCCSKEGCRKRVLPPSVCFIGRKIYWGMIVVMASILFQDFPMDFQKAKEEWGMVPKTVNRWIRIWKERFPQGIFWKRNRGFFNERISSSSFPKGLFDIYVRIEQKIESAVVKLLSFFSPIPALDLIL